MPPAHFRCHRSKSHWKGRCNQRQSTGTRYMYPCRCRSVRCMIANRKHLEDLHSRDYDVLESAIFSKYKAWSLELVSKAQYLRHALRLGICGQIKGALERYTDRPMQGPLVHLPLILRQSTHIGDLLAVQVTPASTVDAVISLGAPEKGLAPAPLKGSTPRALPHQLIPALQLSDIGIHVSVPLVEGNTRKSWAGVPTRIIKVDQAPSLPSQLPLGVREKAWV